MRLRNLLLRWLLIPTLLLWAAGFALSYLRSLAQAHEAYDRTLLGSALVVSENLAVADGEVVADLPYAALEMLRTDAQDRIFYRIASLDTGSHITGYADLPPPPAVPAAEPLFYDAAYKDQAVRIVALRTTLPEGGAQRQLLVQVAETLDARHQLTRRIVSEAAAVQLLLIALAAGLIAWGVRQGLAPLKRLRSEVRARGAHDLTPIDTRAVPREVAPLIHAINTHTERQRQLGEAQARFVANASHQLKTPLTVLRAQVDHALMQTELAAMRQVLTQLNETTDATGRLVGQLLALARSEPGRTLEVTAFDLTELARDATFELLALARSKRIDLGFEGADAVPVHGEAVLLRELVTNLVHNALTYTPEHGRVTVTVAQHDQRAVLTVVDNGPGIAPSERSKVLERFYRAPGTQPQGSGLGLAIAQEICARHGVTMTLGEVPGGGSGLCVALLWPAQDPAPT
ncbi:sensor histidine kinase [Aquabacterium sp.]|uniref:sensor histidine kinase n=1 Tax=Aquabacterium sp. TaxID=1872578 RepID=UPI002CCFB3BE|nr:sensor histidine kinase N-terminal domain-containing protein [Aquabacterium sp.]HSW04906.1 sensor histidine kinase N-terminal domain-containing protein [Aquabacterium sp.]